MKLTTKRLVLRNYKRSDAKSLVENINDKTIWYYTANIPFPYTLRMAKDYIKKCMKEEKGKIPKNIVFAIELKSEKNIIGAVGLHKIDRVNKKCEMGYWLGRKYRRQGIMSEAEKAVLDYAFYKLKLNKIWGECMIENKDSNRLFKKFGFRKIGTCKEDLIKKKRKKDCFLWELLRKDYKPNKPQQ